MLLTITYMYRWPTISTNVKPFTFYQTQPGQKLEHCFSTKICWRAIFLWVLSHEATTKLCWRAIFLWVLSHEATTKNSLNIWHLVILYNNWNKAFPLHLTYTVVVLAGGSVYYSIAVKKIVFRFTVVGKPQWLKNIALKVYFFNISCFDYLKVNYFMLSYSFFRLPYSKFEMC